jgi:hypothetical protein
MSFFKKILLFLFFYFYISNIFIQNAYAYLESGDTLSTSNYEVQTFDVSDEEAAPRDVTFNDDGKKMFIVGNDGDDVDEYTLSTAYDISTAVFVDSFSVKSEDINPMGVRFNNDGSKMFIAGRQEKKVFEYSLSVNFDISEAEYTGNSFDVSSQVKSVFLGLAFSHDGTMMYITDGQGAAATDSIYQFSLNNSFDLSGGGNLIRSVRTGFELETLQTNEAEPNGIAFNKSGTRMFLVGTNGNDVNQYTLSEGFNISSASFDGGVNRGNNPNGIDFSPDGLRMFILDTTARVVQEHHLPCPFNLFAGKCQSITEDSDRAGIAEAQLELAKRTINMSTNSVLNRLKWIKRNEDKQNLSNQNIKLNFSNTMLSSLNQLPISSFKKISTTKKNAESNKKYFYWSEGNITLGRVGDTSIASTKEISTNSLTFGFDKFTDDYGIDGLAFRFGRDDVDVGNSGSHLDSNTFNVTYYNTSPLENDTKFVDKFFGIGKLSSNIITVVDGNKLTAERKGYQLYGTYRLKDEFIKGKLTFISSDQLDLGHTMLKRYKESGKGDIAISVKDQHVGTLNFRKSIAVVEDLSTEKYEFKRHGKLEYLADIDRSSDIKYSYANDPSNTYKDELEVGSFHNINAEIGLDLIFPDRYSIFLIYERNQAINSDHNENSGHNDNLYIAIGYLPYEGAEYAFTINGSENLLSKLEFKKNVNGLNLSFNVNDDLTNLGNNREANIVLNKVF